MKKFKKFVFLFVSFVFLTGIVSAQIQTQVQKIDLNTANTLIKPGEYNNKCDSIKENRAEKINSLLIELKKAEQIKNNELIVKIKEEINYIHKEIERERNECLEQEGFVIKSFIINNIIPTPNFSENIEINKLVNIENPEEIKTYYKEKMQDIILQDIIYINKDIDYTIDSLKILRSEIDLMIAKLIQKKEIIKMSDIESLTDEIIIKPSIIQVNDLVINVDNEKQIEVESKGKEIKIKTNLSEIEIEDGIFKVKSIEELTIKNKQMEIAGKKIEILPTEIASFFKIKPEEVIDFNLSVENNKPVYNIKTLEKRKLFGFIPISVSRSAKIDATALEKNILENNMPWWSFLTFK